MEDGIFTVTDAAVAKANGSTDPEQVAESNGILIGSPLTGSILGMSMRFSYLGSVAINKRLKGIWRMITLWHELGHVFRKHIDEPTFNFHQDRGVFTLPVDSRTIPRQEREANLISAEYCFASDFVLELIGYNNRTMQDYRELKKTQEKLSYDYDFLRFSTYSDKPTNTVRYRLTEYRRALDNLAEKQYDLESEMVSMNCVRTFSEIAGELGTTEVIVKYKLEAMRLRGYDIDIQELERYNQVFSGAK